MEARFLERVLAPIKRRILMMLARSVVLDSNDSKKVQQLKLKILSGEIRDNIESFQNYGVTSRPPDGAEALIVFIGGNRDHGICVGVNDRESRLKDLEKGEVALFTDEENYIWLKRDKELHVRADKLKFQGETDELMQVLVDITSELVDAFDTLYQDTTNTIFGPMQLNSFANYETIKDNLDALKTKLEGIKV